MSREAGPRMALRSLFSSFSHASTATASVDLAHEPKLRAPFRNVALIDTDGIYPKTHWGRATSEVHETVPQVLADHEALVIQFYQLDFFRVSPHVGQGVIFGLVCQAGQKDPTFDAFATGARLKIEKADDIWRKLIKRCVFVVLGH